MRRTQLLWLVLAAVFFGTGCESVYYRNYGFEWNPGAAPREIRVNLVVHGSDVSEDSAGHLVDRRASPYWIGAYVRAPVPPEVEVLTATFVGRQSGFTASPRMTHPEPVGDGSGNVVTEAAQVHLPYEDYSVRLHVRFRGADGKPAEQVILGTLTRKLEQSKRLRWWEQLMSV
jgi:hypothetical protein